MTHPLFEAHRATLDGALDALAKRGYWSPYPETMSGKIYGETANAEAKARFEAQMNKPFELDQTGAGRVGGERSPYGFDLGITYPSRTSTRCWPRRRRRCRPGARRGSRRGPACAWRSCTGSTACRSTSPTPPCTRRGRASRWRSRPRGPHAQDRGLEALAYAYAEMARTPGSVRWEKPRGKGDPIRLDKTYTVVPRGIGLVIGCSTFPTWNCYPAIFADLVTANAVVVKPHPAAVLPLAHHRARRARGAEGERLRSEPDPARRRRRERADRASAGDAAGGGADRLHRRSRLRRLAGEERAAGGALRREGRRQLRRHRFDRRREGDDAEPGLLAVALFRPDVHDAAEHLRAERRHRDRSPGTCRFDDVARGIAGAVDGLLGDPARATEVLGAIQNKATLGRIDEAARQGMVVRASKTLEHPHFAGATVQTPIIVRVEAAREDVYMKEMFGPVTYLIPTADTRTPSRARPGRRRPRARSRRRSIRPMPRSSKRRRMPPPMPACRCPAT